MSDVDVRVAGKGAQKRYRVGDQLWAKRQRVGAHPLYHHAGVVSKIDQYGVILEMVDFGPGAQGEDIPLSEALTSGIWTIPRVLAGEAELELTFPSSDTIVYKRGPESEEARREVELRIADSLDLVRHYHLVLSNCQHYASEMGTGRATSAETSLVVQSLEGIASGSWVKVQAFQGEGWLSQLGNGLLSVLANTAGAALRRYQLFTRLRESHLQATKDKDM